MSIDWEDLLGDDVDLGEAYEERVAEFMERMRAYEENDER